MIRLIISFNSVATAWLTLHMPAYLIPSLSRTLLVLQQWEIMDLMRVLQRQQTLPTNQILLLATTQVL